VAAIKELLDRGWGKPGPSIAWTGCGVERSVAVWANYRLLKKSVAFADEA
jgi:hypothetical protein